MTDTQFFIAILIAIVGTLIAFIGTFKAKKARIQYDSPRFGNFLLIVGVCILISALVYIQTTLNANKEKAIEQYKEGKTTMCVDGNPVGDDFDIDGINLENYSVNVDGDKIYLMSN